MKQRLFLLVLTFFTLILSGCQQPKSSSKSSTSSSPVLVCSGQAYWTTPGCTGYCQNNPSAALCSGGGSTTGSATGGTTGGTTGGAVNCSVSPIDVSCAQYCAQVPRPYGCLANGSNCNVNPNATGCPGASIYVNPYWGVSYPPSGTPPTGTCSDTYVPSGASSAFETRKASITLAGAATGSIEYNPQTAANLFNTSPMLKSVAQSKIFFMTDSVLKLRIKPKPQPESRNTPDICYGRATGTTIPGYTKLQYYVNVYSPSGTNIGSLLGTKGPFITGVNSCSEAIDLSEFQEQSPGGVVVSITNVKANQNCSGSFWNSTGFTNCNIFKNVRSMDCWSMDFEVAADGTKTFD